MNTQFVALVRHGEYHQLVDTPSAFQPFPLTETGRKQAQCSTEKLQHFSQIKKIPMRHTIHCSSLLRAWQTADVIRYEIEDDAILNESPLLGERCVGSLANLSTETIETLLHDDPRYTTPAKGWKSDSHYRLPFPGAESLLEAGERVADYLRQLMQPLCSTPSALQIVVGHGAAFRHAAHLLGVFSFEDIAQLSMYYDQPVFLSVNDDGWQFAGGQWKPRSAFEVID